MARTPPIEVSVDEFCDFYNDRTAWYDGGVYMDDNDDSLYNQLFNFNVPGTEDIRPLQPGQVVKLKKLDGVIVWQGKSDQPGDLPDTVADLFLRWRKNRTTDTLVFTVPKDKVKAVNDAVQKALGK